MFISQKPSTHLMVANIPASRERRLNSIVADAKWKTNHGRRGFKPTAKFRRRYAAGRGES
jgi:hypothetical protein